MLAKAILATLRSSVNQSPSPTSNGELLRFGASWPISSPGIAAPSPLESHDRYRATVFGDPRLVGMHHVHDDATLEHLGQAKVDLSTSTLLLVRVGNIDSCRPVSRPRVSLDDFDRLGHRRTLSAATGCLALDRAAEP